VKNQTGLSEPMDPVVVSQFADLLHERRSQVAPPFTRNSKSMVDLWTILHEREVVEIDQALARIRRGSYGSCEVCGAQIQYLQLFMHPTEDCCLACRPQSRSVRTA